VEGEGKRQVVGHPHAQKSMAQQWATSPHEPRYREPRDCNTRFRLASGQTKPTTTTKLKELHKVEDACKQPTTKREPTPSLLVGT
jgi:hypothetical protein